MNIVIYSVGDRRLVRRDPDLYTIEHQTELGEWWPLQTLRVWTEAHEAFWGTITPTKQLYEHGANVIKMFDAMNPFPNHDPRR